MPSATQALAWALRPLPFLERCARRYGDVFTLRVRRGAPWVVLTDPEDVKLVFTADAHTVGASATEASPALGPLLGPRSVMLLEEPEHVRRRKLMLPPFHGERMRGYGEMMADVTRRELRGWPREEPFELWPRMQEITLEAIMRVVFGEVETDRMRRLRTLLRELTDWMNDPRRLTLLAAAGPRWLAGNTGYREVMAPVEATVLAEARERREHPDATAGQDIASMFAQACYEDGAPMTEQDLRDELVTLLTDGPTSALLSWTFERLLRHPDKLARLRVEVLAGEQDEYLDAVVKETLRLCPAAPIVVRRLLEPMTLGGYEIPAGTTVAPCVHLVHRREDIYPQPLRFLPERFLGAPAEPYTWIPFGGGVRRCLAASYAMLLLEQVTRTVLEEVELRTVEPRSERARKSAITFVPDRHGLVTSTAREAPPREVPRREPGGDELAQPGFAANGSADYTTSAWR
jgi:cytochrome P450